MVNNQVRGQGWERVAEILKALEAIVRSVTFTFTEMEVVGRFQAEKGHPLTYILTGLVCCCVKSRLEGMQ